MLIECTYNLKFTFAHQLHVQFIYKENILKFDNDRLLEGFLFSSKDGIRSLSLHSVFHFMNCLFWKTGI